MSSVYFKTYFYVGQIRQFLEHNILTVILFILENRRSSSFRSFLVLIKLFILHFFTFCNNDNTQKYLTLLCKSHQFMLFGQGSCQHYKKFQFDITDTWYFLVGYPNMNHRCQLKWIDKISFNIRLYFWLQVNRGITAATMDEQQPTGNVSFT